MNALSQITKRHVLSALFAAPILFSCAYASAEDAAPVATVAAAPAEPAPPYTLTFNLGLYSTYMFRGVDYSDGPALQGGIDWAHSSGFYLGTWFSNLDPYAYGDNGAGLKGNHLETDFYGGYAHTFENGLGVNFLGNYYKYLEGRNSLNNHKQDSFEASVALSYKWFTYTYYNVLTDYYGQDEADNATLTVTGNRNTKYSDYHELKVNYNLPIGDLGLMAKVGYQTTKNLQGDEGDWAIGLTRNFSLPTGGKPLEGFSAGATATGTFAVKNQAYYTYITDSTGGTRKANEGKLWFFVKRSW
jgi:uncharacterized protein (TIGR02001 family)